MALPMMLLHGSVEGSRNAKRLKNVKKYVFISKQIRLKRTLFNGTRQYKIKLCFYRFFIFDMVSESVGFMGRAVSGFYCRGGSEM